MEPSKPMHLLLIFLSLVSVTVSTTQVKSPSPSPSPSQPNHASTALTPSCSTPAPAPSANPPASPPVSASPSPHPGPTTTDPVVKKICAVTNNVDLCLSSIAQYLTGKIKVDPSSILEMEVKACQELSKVTKAKAWKISEDPSTAGFTAQIMSVCLDTYDEAISSLDKAIAALKARDYPVMNNMLSAAMAMFGTCDDAFSERPGSKSPVGDLDETLSKLTSNCLAIGTLLK